MKIPGVWDLREDLLQLCMVSWCCWGICRNVMWGAERVVGGYSVG